MVTMLPITVVTSHMRLHHFSHGYITLVLYLVAMVQQTVAIEMKRYVWKTGGWSLCRSDRCGGSGSTTRAVTCVETTSNRTLLPSDCNGLPRPPTYTTCYRVCDYHRHQYRWQKSDWSVCKPRFGKRMCEEDYGIQHRNVTCVAKCGGVAPSEVFCEQFEHKPQTKQLCPLHCPEDCVMSDYSSWTMCASCFHKQKSRHKTILRAPANGGASCRNLVDYEPCVRSNECYELRSSNFQYKFSNWSDCVPLDRRTRKRLEGHPILGHQKRVVTCTDVSGFDVDQSLCAHLSRLSKPVTDQICVLPRDCLVSHWTTWSNWTSIHRPYPSGTAKPADHNNRFRAPVHMRQRNLIQVPRGEGKVCPALAEERGVQGPSQDLSQGCHSHQLTEGPWSGCLPQVSTDHCGTGVQHRTILCTRTNDRVVVEDFHCTSEAPPHTRSCDLPCPAHCEVTEWGGWGECLPDKCRASENEHINAQGYRVRRRHIERESGDGGRGCPHLAEFQDCRYPLCYHWTAELTSSECKLKYKDMICGEGALHRVVMCIDFYGENADEALCGYQSKPANSEPCHIPCGNDCVLTSWTEWSQCPHPEQCGHEDVVVRARNRQILARAGSIGQACPPERLLEEKEKCPEVSCHRYFWKTSQWSTCRVTGATGYCGTGAQTRQVSCHKVIDCEGETYCPNSRKVASKHCPASHQPALTQNCSTPCTPDCHTVVSAFTDWTPCTATCIEDGGAIPIQQRYRFFVDQTMVPYCTHTALVEARGCGHLPKCLRYSWRLSGWTQCVVMGGCGRGFHARDVECLSSGGEVVEEEICVSQLGSQPDRVAPCQVTECRGVGGCQFSDWSQWSGCTERCDGVRTRFRSMQGNTKRRAECHDSSTHPLTEKTSCDHCSKFYSQPHGRWSSCVLTSNQGNQTQLYGVDGLAIGMLRPSYSVCGVGRRHQALVCTDGRGNNVSASVCFQKDFVEEMCFTLCPQDCVMTDWSPWSSCQAHSRCGNGQRSRFRYVKKPSIDGGRPCPPLVEGEQYEYDPCHVGCEQFYWEPGPWSSCMVDVKLDSSGQCGSGIQTRTLRCMQKSEDESVVVDAIKCDTMVKPADHNYCSVICPGHCVLTEWSVWSPCQQGCHGKRNRSRSIARYPSQGSLNCQHLVEIEDCQPGNNCYLYTLSWSHWGSCLLRSSQDCGVGARRSYSQCVRSDGAVVDRKFCLQDSSSPAEVVGVMTEECLVACPVDCVISQWTPWTQCSHSCDIGYQQRFRHIVLYPASRGRSCPRELTQERPCSFTECFKWRVSDWGHCHIQSGVCGFGTQVRNLTCVRHDSLQVDTILCPEGGKTHFLLSRSCLKACPGDCWLSDWSTWGACHRPCVDGIQAGAQTRSRAILASANSATGLSCPSDLTETRPCWGGYCPVYAWKTSNWFGDRRHVWCESNNGVVVEGGCSPDRRVSSVRLCDPECLVTNSYCSDINHCSCTTGYSGIYNQYGHLTDCQELTAMYNKSKHTAEGVLLPDDGLTNFWMYAVIVAGTAFILFVVVAVYVILKYSRRDQQNEMSLRSSRSTTIRQNVHGQKPPLKDNTSDTYHKDEYS